MNAIRTTSFIALFSLLLCIPVTAMTEEDPEVTTATTDSTDEPEESSEPVDTVDRDEDTGEPIVIVAPEPELPKVQVLRQDRPLNLKAQRYNYERALRAARQGNVTTYKRLLSDLEGYPLLALVEYEYLKRRVGRVPDADIIRYISENRHAVFSDFLRQRWLQDLAKRGQWDTFMKHYGGRKRKDKQLQCYRLQRLLKTSHDQAAVMAEIEKLWLTGKRLSAACNPVFKEWSKAGHMTQDLIWSRIKLAMESRRISLARELSYYLSKHQRVWVTRWINMHRHPSTQLANIRYPVATPIARTIVKHGIYRLARRNPAAAMEHWKRLKQEYQFFGEDENYILRQVGILAAQHHLPEAVEWLTAVSASEDDHELYEWRVRAALRNQDWELAGQFLRGLSLEAQEQEEWRYWRARILEQQGRTKEAREQLEALARNRSYYGFLASDHIGATYSMQHQSVAVKPVEIGSMLARPEVRLARELHAVGDTLDARRQWNWMTKKMNRRDLQVAAYVAKEWGWHDRAILTVSKSGHLDDLDLRFPVLYRDKVEKNADRVGIDPSWIYGVMRQESAFVSDARSGAGALGLMQLMPRTGRQTARRLKLNIRSRSAILNVDNNLRLGSYYLKRVLDRNDGNQTLATASYNAGPHRVKRWLPENDMEADIWVETVPFTETRNYIKNVFGFAAIYDHRLGYDSPTRIKSRMPEVAGKKNQDN